VVSAARRALAILVDEGLIEIVHGWGSFVRKP
jgi:DNA-binding GntR family transcriptional regulator